MIDGLIGRKRGTTQIFTPEGKRIQVTVIEAGPCRVIQLKKSLTDGYEAVQVGFAQKKHPLKRDKQHAAKANVAAPAVTREFKPIGEELPQLGQEINVSVFQVGELVDISGVSKGKGFQGVVRRFRFAGGPASRGSNFHRRPGSIGCRALPGKVHKGKRLPGHMGSEHCTNQKLKVVAVEPETNILLVQGSVPGSNNGIIKIVKSRKVKR